MEKYFMGQDGFVWFTGVVEDRSDPSELGRVKVRCLGYHTESLDDLPTNDLPWAHVIHPVTDPSMQGLGNSPSFLVEGCWVVGFFLDAREKQQPIIMGTLPGIASTEADNTKGFNDPRGNDSPQVLYKGTPTYGPYPYVGEGEDDEVWNGHELNEPDTSLLGRGKKSENHTSLIDRRNNRENNDGKGIPIATKPNIKTVSDTLKTTEIAKTFEEPHPKSVDFEAYIKNNIPYSSSQYPYNHVFESESGHVMEVDDSPEAERLLRYHKTGTFEEIHPNADRVVKVVGKNYEIIADSNNVFVNGDVNLTATGNYNQLIKGDYVLEVEGNYTRKIHKNEQVKIGVPKEDDDGNLQGGGNLEEEINGNHSFNVVNSVKGAVGTTKTGTSKDFDVTIGGSETRSVGGSQRTVVTTDILFASTTDEMILSANTNMSLSTALTTGVMSIKAGGTTNIGSVEAVTINYEKSLSETVGTSVTESYGSLATSISGTTAINHTGIATYQYKDAFKERIEKDHFVTKITGFTDHTATVDPARATGTTAVDAIT